MDDFYKQALKESPVGFAYHKIHLNADGLPCDYEFIEVNVAFESFTGLKKKDIIGKRVTEVIPGIVDDKFDWIKIYGDIALNGGTSDFEHFSEALQRHYKIKVFSDKKYYFSTQFTDSSSEIILATDLNILLEMSDELLQLEKGKDINYQNITGCLKKISGAKFIVFNLYEEDGKHYHTAAVSGDKGSIKKAESMLGFDFRKPRWTPNSAIDAKVKAFTVSKFHSLENFAGDTIPKPIVHSIEKIFKLGEIVFIRIAKGDIVLGDFQMFMKIGEVFDKTRIVEIFAKQVGTAIERSRAERDLIESEQRYTFLFEHSGLAVGFYTIDGTVISFNKKAIENMGGDGIEEYEGKSIYELFPKAEADFYMGRLLKAVKTDLAEEYIDFVSLNPGDKWFSSTFKRICNHENEVIGVQIISQDITARMNAEKDLKVSENRFREVLQNLEAGVVVHDMDSKIIDCNKRAEEMLGLSKEQLLGVVSIDSRWCFLSESGVQLPLEEYPVSLVLNSKKPIKNKVLGIYDPNAKSTTWVAVNGTPLYNQLGEMVEAVISFIDITERKKSEEIMTHLSFHDQLTGLYNRRFYEEELKRLDNERNLPITLIMVDVNGLKITNDAFGHQEGDKLLQKISKIFKTKCRSDEIVSRIGGDEFIILLPKTDESEACNLIDRIMEAVAKEAEKNGTLSISLGYAVKTASNENIDDVFKRAEDDMYRHKLSESSSMRSKTIDLIMNSLFEKSNREMLHSKRVSSISEQIAEKMYFPKENIRQIVLAGLMHDIGKIGISNEILDKEGDLTTDEFIEVKKHSEAGYRILSSVSEFSNISQYVLSHHERWDGKGYPQGIKGNAIPIQARIIAIADAYDAMTSDRTYRNKMSEEDAIIEIKRCSGAQFDPDIVKIFTENVMRKN